MSLGRAGDLLCWPHEISRPHPTLLCTRWRRRRELFHDFRRHMERTANVRLHIVEVAFGDRPFEVTSSENPNDVQLRTSHTLWLKKNALNIGVQRLPSGWKYAAYVDADFHFTRHDRALETIHKLQYSPWVQPYSSYGVIGPDNNPLQVRPALRMPTMSTSVASGRFIRRPLWRRV